MKKKFPKILAIYLPQFYENEDNNTWWGKGFTDWISVKENISYFKGHESPWIPKENNYYDLSDWSVLKQQALVARKYGVDGFCFYHYYFKDGKKELEIPAENLLKHPEIDIEYCFNWANESWIRSWSKFSGNVWGEKIEAKTENDDDGVLVEQDYGNEEDWEKHFYYLLPFFRDKRYIKIDNKPVFIFYRPKSVNCLKEMTLLWRKLAKKAGFKDLYLIGVNTNSNLLCLDASLLYQPRCAIDALNKKKCVEIKNGVRCFQYSQVWEETLDLKPYYGSKTYFTGVVGYDDTPRRGKSGECFIDRTPKCFQEGLEKLIQKSIDYENELVFLNAWNEWGEGMFLEEDEKYGDLFLSAVKNAKNNTKNYKKQISDFKANEDIGEELKTINNNLNKFSFFTQILVKWLECERLNNINLSNWLKDNAFNSVAIYGMGVLGKQLYQQLKKEKIMLKFAIDRYVGAYDDNGIILRPEDKIPEVDVIVITAYDYKNIMIYLQKKTNAKIVLIQDIIEYFWRKTDE